MSIERLTIAEGLLIDSPEELHPLIGRVITERGEEFVTLAPGEYDLTPKAWGDGNRNKYNLLVHPNGEATSRSYPVNEGASMARMQDDRVEVSGRQAGTMKEINARNRFFAIVGVGSQGKGNFLYEVIGYLE